MQLSKYEVQQERNDMRNLWWWNLNPHFLCWILFSVSLLHDNLPPTYFANVLLEHDSKQLHNSSSLHMWLKKWAHLCVLLLHANSENKGGKTSSHFWIITNQNYEEFLENTWNALVRWRSTIEITYLPNVISLYVC